MDAELLRQLQDRGRFFYERFPGAAAAEEWLLAMAFTWNRPVSSCSAHASQDAPIRRF